MNKFKKALLTSTVAALTLGTGLAVAQNKNAPVEQPSSKSAAVLFKIHDIKPVADSEGNVQSCEYTATFFNRTNITVRQAKMDLTWVDNISSLYPIEEKEESENKAKPEVQNTKAPELKAPVQNEADLIHATLDIPSLNPLKQVVLKGTVQTDKCFALFDNLSFRVSECNTLNAQESTNERVNRANDAKNQTVCASLFTYISSKNPEYYDEFKEVSYEEQVVSEKEAEVKETAFIENANKKITEQIEKIKEVLAKIK